MNRLAGVSGRALTVQEELTILRGHFLPDSIHKERDDTDHAHKFSSSDNASGRAARAARLPTAQGLYQKALIHNFFTLRKLQELSNEIAHLSRLRPADLAHAEEDEAAKHDKKKETFIKFQEAEAAKVTKQQVLERACLLYTSPSPRD